MAKTTNAEVEELTEQFYVTLRAYVARLRPEDEQRSPKSFQQIQDLLNGQRAVWSDAYQIEQLIVDLYDDRTLEIELQSRLLEAESNLRPALTGQYLKSAAELKTPTERRALLARLVNDLQWRYTVNEVKRTYSKDITKVTGIIFIVAIVLFALTVFGLFQMRTQVPREASLLLLAASAGGWGAAFSMLAGLKNRLELADLNDLKLLRSRWIIWSRPLIGVGAASIFYFFCASGLVGGPVFPVPAAGTQLPATAATGASLPLLIVWCFIAGFSERLVPALLAKTEDRASGQATAEADRFKPSATTIAQADAGADRKAEAPASPAPAASPAGGAAAV